MACLVRGHIAHIARIARRVKYSVAETRKFDPANSKAWASSAPGNVASTAGRRLQARQARQVPTRRTCSLWALVVDAQKKGEECVFSSV